MSTNPHNYPNGRWQVGDQAITMVYGNRVEIIARPRESGLVLVRYAVTGREGWIQTYDLRRETFWEFITRPSGFGRTGWWKFALIVVLVVLGCVYGAITWGDGGGWAITFAVLVVTWVIIGTVGNFKGWIR